MTISSTPDHLCPIFGPITPFTIVMFFDQAHSSLVIIIGNWINNDHVIIERGRHSPAVSNFKFFVNSSVKSPNWYIYRDRYIRELEMI